MDDDKKEEGRLATSREVADASILSEGILGLLDAYGCQPGASGTAIMLGLSMAVVENVIIQPEPLEALDEFESATRQALTAFLTDRKRS